MNVHAELISHGTMTWAHARDFLGDAECTWTDLDGMHFAPAPETVPVTTHLWGWRGDRCFRARVDEHDVYLAELRLADNGSIRAYRREAHLRPETRAAAPHLVNRETIDVIELPGQQPITFLRLSSS